MALLLFAVLVPAVCLIWFMGAAMRNERLAARQRLADAYRTQLFSSQAHLQQFYSATATKLEQLTAGVSAPLAFAKCVESGLVDSVILFEGERIVYPNLPAASKSSFGELEPKWQEANHLEDLHKYLEAANRYDDLARDATNTNAAARAFQAEARCRLQAGQKGAVIQLVDRTLGSDRYRQAVDLQGRLIAANAELMALELITNRSSPVFQSIARRLATRLMDYENPALAAPQRLFLMKEIQKLSPEAILPTLAAERMAADLIEKHSNLASDSILRRGALPDLWHFTTPNHRVFALIRSQRLMAAAKAAVDLDRAIGDAKVTIVPPEVDTADALVTLAAGEQMPGWRLALFLRDGATFEAAAGRQNTLYLWTAILVMGAIGVVTLITVRLVRRKMALARLKNDLAATVSHELKTPLASMRVLVDTLLDSARFDERKTRDYLELIAQENDRLGRLIQNFLTFSRMERRKYACELSLLPSRQIVDAAIQTVRGRFDVPGCRLELQIEPNLPTLLADQDALVAALSNLLENAYKYSEEIKHIVLRARAANGTLLLSVTDNGIGISPRERKKIFQPFYQGDRRLSRRGSGCGLGLSIVQFIVAAHHGTVSVESEPGRGSTFTLSIPTASNAAMIGKEAIA